MTLRLSIALQIRFRIRILDLTYSKMNAPFALTPKPFQKLSALLHCGKETPVTEVAVPLLLPDYSIVPIDLPIYSRDNPGRHRIQRLPPSSLLPKRKQGCRDAALGVEKLQ